MKRSVSLVQWYKESMILEDYLIEAAGIDMMVRYCYLLVNMMWWGVGRKAVSEAEAEASRLS